MQGVLVVLLNYRRPQNMLQVIAAWRKQTVPAKIVVVDNSPWYDYLPYPDHRFNGADDVWRFQENLGCPARFAPAFAMHGHKYVLFADDDYLPGMRALEHLLETATEVEDCFATIGESARMFRLDQPELYSGHSVPHRSDKAASCHLTCQGHLVCADMFQYVIEFRNDLLERFGAEAEKLVSVHDDFLLCLGIQRGTGWPSLAVPFGSEDQQLIRTRLDEGNVAVWRRPGHFQERCRMVQMSLECGWRPHGN